MSNRIHLLAGTLSAVCLLGGIGPAAADGGSETSDGRLRIAQVQPEQKSGKPETEEEKAKKKKNKHGPASQDPAAPSPLRRGHGPAPEGRPPQAKGPDSPAKERLEPRRRSFGQTDAQPPQSDRIPPGAVPAPALKPAEQVPLRAKPPAAQAMPHPSEQSAPVVRRPAEPKSPAALQRPAQPGMTQPSAGVVPGDPKSPTALQQSAPQVMPQPYGQAGPSVQKPAELKRPVPPQQPAAQVVTPPGGAVPLLQQPLPPAVPGAAAPSNQQAVAPLPTGPDAPHARHERLKQLREERAKARQEVHEDREQARQELREVQEQRRDLVQDQRAEHLERRLQRLEEIQQQRRERVEDGGQRTIIEEPDKRVIIRDHGRVTIRHDENERVLRTAHNVRTERRGDGTTVTVYARPDGAEIVSVVDAEGRLMRRARRTREGREFVLIDNSRHYHRDHHGRGGAVLDVVVNLPAPIVRLPREKYVVEYASASEGDVYEALSAPPIERLDRAYSLDEVRQSYHLRERMRRVDLDAINFEFGSWEVAPDQYSKLERVAAAMRSVLDRNPDEVFLIEGHTDAVGSDVDNLSLSDRRAESVAVILSETFRVPPENLTTQGYGEEHLKIETPGAERANRRVAVRRITPLLAPPAG